MRPIRNSTKAIIIENGKLLLLKFQFDPAIPHFTYLLPGGGQEKGEPLSVAMQRELREELGCDAQVGDLAFVREFIDPHSRWGDMHQVEFFFHCTLLSPIDMAAATAPDAMQVDTLWVPLDALDGYEIFPSKLKDYIGPDGRITGDIYMGKC